MPGNKTAFYSKPDHTRMRFLHSCLYDRIVWSCDHDPDQMTLLYKLDLYIPQMYHKTDNECSRSQHSNFTAGTGHKQMPFRSCDHNLDPMTFIYKLYLLKLQPQNRNKLSTTKLSEVILQTDRQVVYQYSGSGTSSTQWGTNGGSSRGGYGIVVISNSESKNTISFLNNLLISKYLFAHR